MTSTPAQITSPADQSTRPAYQSANMTDRPSGPEHRGGRIMRLRGLIRKELLQILRDPSSIGIAFLMPILLLFIFGYGVSLDAKHVPIALVSENPGTDVASFWGSFYGSEYFRPVTMSNMHEAREALMSHQVNGIVYLQSDFSRRLRQPEGAPIQVVVNGVDANTARLTLGYVDGAWSSWLQQKAREEAIGLVVPVQAEQRIWFNSEVRSENFLVPGLIALICTLIGALLTALVVSREWERGTMEALMVTPVGIGEILLGKLIPYFLLGTGGMLLTVVLAEWAFHVPMRGSLWVLFASASLFLVAALGMGLLISTVAKNQFVAGQIAIIATFLPAFILSGFIFDIGSMPTVIQTLTRLMAARYFVAILQTVYLAGDVWYVILPNALALAIMASIFLGLTWRKSRKRLE
jgi:ABC-2 type transport system permease protein